jgi:hypothetical protein
MMRDSFNADYHQDIPGKGRWWFLSLLSFIMVAAREDHFFRAVVCL